MSILSSNLQSQTNPQKVWTEKAAAAWFKKGEWKNGLKLKAHKSVDKLEFAKQYELNRTRWDEAFAYLKNTDLAALKPGKYPIDGENVFATVAEADKKDYEATKWESHRKYTDIQLVITGKEKMGVTPASSLTVVQPYDETKDLIFYDGSGKGVIHTAEPGTFFIFFPQNSHRPDIRVDGIPQDKKIVIKVRNGV